MRTISTLIAAPLLADGCVGSEPLPGDKVDERYTVDGARWDSGGTVYVFVRAFEDRGKVAVCGAWASDDAGTLSVTDNRRVMEAAAVELDGTRVLDQLRRFPRMGEPRAARGASAACFRSTVDWRPSFADADPNVVFGRIFSDG